MNPIFLHALVGHCAALGRGLVTMAIWSGPGRTWSTAKPAGIRGRMRLDKHDFQKWRVFHLCSRAYPKRRDNSTQTAGEPKIHGHSHRTATLPENGHSAARPTGP